MRGSKLNGPSRLARYQCVAGGLRNHGSMSRRLEPMACKPSTIQLRFLNGRLRYGLTTPCLSMGIHAFRPLSQWSLKYSWRHSMFLARCRVQTQAYECFVFILTMTTLALQRGIGCL